MAHPERLQDPPEVDPDVLRVLQRLGAVSIVAITPADLTKRSIPSGDWLSCPLLHEHLQTGGANTICKVWDLVFVRRRLSLTCRTFRAIAVSASFALAAVSVGRQIMATADPTFLPRGGARQYPAYHKICALYTVLRMRLARPLHLPDFAFYLQLLSDCPSVKERHLAVRSSLNVGDWPAHSLYMHAITGRHSDEDDDQGLQEAPGGGPIWPYLIQVMLVGLEEHLIALIPTLEEEARLLVTRLLAKLLKHSGFIEGAPWLQRLARLVTLLGLPRDAPFRVVIFDIFCYVSVAWTPAVLDDPAAVAGTLLMGSNGLGATAPLRQLLIEVEETAPCCLFSDGLVRCVGDIRNGLADEDNDLGALRELMERFKALLARCACHQCTDLHLMAADC